MTIDLEIARNRLSRRKAELEELSRLSEGSRSTVMLDQQAVGRLSRMDSIEMAERRINEGDYGYCVGCDNEIPDKRLEIDPMAEKCVQCAS